MRSALPSRLPRLVRAGLAGLMAGLLFALPVGPAIAQEAPASDTAKRAVDLTDPGVVFIATAVAVTVRLIYQNQEEASGLSNIDQSYKLDYASGSGFVVNPNGTIVTASHVIEPDREEIQNYAANQLFFGGGLGYKLRADQNPFEQFSITDSRFLNSLLQQCYQGVACRFGITPSVSVYTPVQIAGTSAPKGLPARVLESTGFDNTDVAVVKVDGSNLPTVPLAATAGDLRSGTSVTALGFAGSAKDLPTGVTEPTKAFGRVSSVRSNGTSKVVQVDMRIEGGMSGGPVIDDSGKVIGLTSFTGVAEGARQQGFLRTVDDIKATLRGAGVSDARGEVDAVFTQAMDYFWGQHYSAALPLYQKVLNLYPAHPAATQFLSQAQAKANGPEDKPLDNGGFPVVLVAGIALAVLVVLGVVVALLVLGRRRRSARPAPVAPAAWGQPPLATATPPFAQAGNGGPAQGFGGNGGQAPHGYGVPAASGGDGGSMPQRGHGGQAPGFAGPAASGGDGGSMPQGGYSAPVAPGAPSPAPNGGSGHPAPPEAPQAALATPEPVGVRTEPLAGSAGAAGAGAAATEPAASGQASGFCSSCGAERSTGAFCSSCGHRFE